MAPTTPVSIAGAPLDGRPTAPVVIVEYADFECASCAAFANGPLHTIENAYISHGDVALALRNLPNVREHPHALRAAVAANCADRQGKFLDLHDQLFKYSSRLNDATIRHLADSVGIDGKPFDACLGGTAATDQITRDVGEATDLGIFDIPTFLIGTRLPDGTVHATSQFSGTVSFDNFKSTIDGLLATATVDQRPK